MWIFYITSLLAALLGGMVVTVMLLLYAAVRDLISAVSPEGESNLYAEEEGEADGEESSERERHSEEARD